MLHYRDPGILSKPEARTRMHYAHIQCGSEIEMKFVDIVVRCEYASPSGARKGIVNFIGLSVVLPGIVRVGIRDYTSVEKGTTLFRHIG